MGTQNQTPNSPGQQQPGKPQPGMTDAEREQKSKRTAKDTANPPHDDDDVADEGNQGTREDAAGSNDRKS